MNKKRKKKAIVLSLALASMLLTPMTMNAQYDEHKFGLQPWYGSSLMGRESGNTKGNLDVQDSNGNISVEDFGTPIGSGSLILLAAGVGYAAMKRRKNESTKENN